MWTCCIATLGGGHGLPTPTEAPWGSPMAPSLPNTDPWHCLCPTACARSSCQPPGCPSRASASTRCAACSTSTSALPRCETGSSGLYPLRPVPAAHSDPSTKHQVLWFSCCSWACAVPLAREALGRPWVDVSQPWWECAEVLWSRGSFCDKGANAVGANGLSLGRREITSRVELIQGRTPSDTGTGFERQQPSARD